MLQLVFFLKLFKKSYYQSEILREVQHKSGLLHALSISLLTIDALVIAHFCACFFIGIDLSLYAQQYYGNNTSLYWLSNNADYINNLFGGLWYIQYIYGQEYSSGTLSTLAPGPFPKNPLEVVLSFPYVDIRDSSYAQLHHPNLLHRRRHCADILQRVPTESVPRDEHPGLRQLP